MPELTRRQVAQGAAWSVPAILFAQAAPAVAASCRPTSYTLSWGGSNTSLVTSADGLKATATVADPDGSGPAPAIQLSMAASYVGGMHVGAENRSDNQNFRVTSSAASGTNEPALRLHQSVTTTSTEGPGRSARGIYTFTFSQPVSNLRFQVMDIDSGRYDFWDGIELSPGFTYTKPAGMNGNGLPPDSSGNAAFYISGSHMPVDNTSGTAGNVVITYPGTLRSFTITFWNGQPQLKHDVDQDQLVHISAMTFTHLPQTC